jgi:hypothetical protein
VNQWTLGSLTDLFKNFRKIKHKIRELYTSMEKSMKIARDLEQAFAPYTMLHNEMNKKKSSSL